MKNRRHARRVKRLALICTLCTVILVVSTYAWFIGMRTVNVSSFDVEIAATDGLTLSLNGQTYAETVSINAQNFNDVANKVVYSGNTNTWSDGGLIPISTIGKIDQDLSRLVLYEKGSLTVTPGGYRLMASRVKNFKEDASGAKSVESGKIEGKGFVAFDLFIRNLSGNAYYTDFNELNEEAIYLTQNSEVKVIASGAGDGSEENQAKTGIENSVRVAFAQIGRVEATKGNDITAAKAKDVQGITCEKDSAATKYYNSTSKVTGSCSKDAKIWEPNDMKHVKNAINWYTTSCKGRTGKELTDSASYSGDCKSFADTNFNVTKYVQTYAINSEIDYSDKVDVYDGKDYNGYEGSIYSATNTSGKLTAYDYYTDTEKMKTGVDRIPFFSLAPNSITKVRVYIYLEGQDIDNYDFASLGKKIQVQFGFTKERFYNTDINYYGPETTTDGIVIPKTPETISNNYPVTPEEVANE